MRIRRTLKALALAGTVATAYLLGAQVGAQAAPAPSVSVATFTACIGQEAGLRAQDGGPVNYGPCLQAAAGR